MRGGPNRGALKILMILATSSKLINSRSSFGEWMGREILYTATTWRGILRLRLCKNWDRSLYTPPPIITIIIHTASMRFYTPTATVQELRQKPLYTTPSGRWWCIESVLRSYGLCIFSNTIQYIIIIILLLLIIMIIQLSLALLCIFSAATRD